MSKKMRLLGAFLFLLLSSAERGSIERLSDDDIDERLLTTEIASVIFYKQEDNLKKLNLEFEEAARELAKEKSPVVFFKINCAKSGKKSCEKYEISDYPSVKIFQNGVFLNDYKGPKDALDVAEYMRTVGGSQEISFVLGSLPEFLKDKKEVYVIGTCKPGSVLEKEFLKTAQKLRNRFKFRHLTNYLEEIEESVILYRPAYLSNRFEDTSVKYPGKGSLESFIEENRNGLVGHRTRGNVEDFGEPLVVALFKVDYSLDKKGTNYWRNRVLKVAQNHKQLVFAISSMEDFPEDFSLFPGDPDGSKPLVMASNGSDKFLMKEDFSVNTLDNFVRSFLEGRVKPYVRSEPIPEMNRGPVLVAVADNFEEVVVENGKDTLVEFYAPWCGHCRSLAPTYEQLAKKLEGEDVVVAKMDATANDVPRNYTVEGYPTIYWKAKSEKYQPIVYEGGRDLQDFIDYIAGHATLPLNKFDRDGNAKKTEL